MIKLLEKIMVLLLASMAGISFMQKEYGLAIMVLAIAFLFTVSIIPDLDEYNE